MAYCIRKFSRDEVIALERTSTNLPIEQSIYWFDFQNLLLDRNSTGIVGIFSHNKLIFWALPIEIDMRLYRFVWCKFGPIFWTEDQNMRDDCLKLFKQYCQTEYPQSIFVRLQSATKPQGAAQPWTPSMRETRLISLQGSREDILAQMKSKGRYNIRLAEKKSLHIEVIDSYHPELSSKLDIFLDLLKETTTRDRFSHHPKSYYQAMMQGLDGKAELIFASTEEQKVIAAILITYTPHCVTYYYGASLHEYRALMAPYLLQWTAICKAKERGAHFYDLFGIRATGIDHWQGVRAFKEQFGGEIQMIDPEWDIPLQKTWYFLLKSAQWIRSFFR